MWLVVGLGNPGRSYEAHRHNVGFMVVDALAKRADASDFREKFSGLCCSTRVGGEPVALLKPQTYMNESGRSVQPAAAFFKVPPERVLIIHDELDLPFGELRLKPGGGHAGHNGLRSLTTHLGTGEFPRVRFGIGRPPRGFGGEVADFVLAPFGGDERIALSDLVDKAAQITESIVEAGLAPAMSTHNAKAPQRGHRPRPDGATAKQDDETQDKQEEQNASGAPRATLVGRKGRSVEVPPPPAKVANGDGG